MALEIESPILKHLQSLQDFEKSLFGIWCGSVGKIFDLLVKSLRRYRGLGLTVGSDWVVTVVDFKGAHYPKSVILFGPFAICVG